MTEEITQCPRCASADWNPEDEEGGWPSCNDCGFVLYDAWTLEIQAEVKREQAHAKRVLGYVPTYQEAREKGFTK